MEAYMHVIGEGAAAALYFLWGVSPYGLVIGLFVVFVKIFEKALE